MSDKPKNIAAEIDALRFERAQAGKRAMKAESKYEALREAVSNMNPNNPFSVIEVQILVEEKGE